MTRVTEAEVQALIPDVDTDISMTPFITAAGVFTDRVDNQDADGVLTAACLKEIERYLSAHLYHHKDHQYAQKKTGDASATFQGKFDLGLDGTYWGQTAKRLDFTGYLASLDKPLVRARGVWLGRPPSEQTDYKDRD